MAARSFSCRAGSATRRQPSSPFAATPSRHSSSKSEGRGPIAPESRVLPRRLLTHSCRPPSAGSWRPRGIASIRVQGKSALPQGVLVLATQRFCSRHRVACQNQAQPRPVLGRVPSVGIKGDSSPLPLKDLALQISAEDLSSD